MVSPKGGEVRIGTGQGFERIVAPTEVAAGAQVMVSPTGAASIAYSETCVVIAPAAAITVIASEAPCAGLPEPSYLGFASSNEQGIAGEGTGVEGDQLAFTPKVDAPDAPKKKTAETPEKTQGPAPRASKPASVQGSVQDKERHGDHDGLLLVGGVVVGAGVLAAVLASQGSDEPASP
jgi:hypothetical protein